MENVKFEKIDQFITFTKKVSNTQGASTTICINIPQMSNDDLVKEVKSTCKVMKKCSMIIVGNVPKQNIALAATTGATNKTSPHEAARTFEKCFGILVKLNNEIVLRGLSKEVQADVQDALQRKTGVECNFDDEEQLMLGN